MPTVFTINGFRFFFYSNENEEPVHVHVEKGEKNCKIWLIPNVNIAYNHDFSPAEIKQIISILQKNLITLINKWYEFFAK